jgi:uncharacterized membrane protein
MEWEAEITNQEPDSRIAWRNTDGAYNAGLVTFQPDEGGTRVTLRIDYEPDGALEQTGSALGLVSGRVEGDLKRFKEFVESRGVPTGAWRGEVRGGTVSSSGSMGGGQTPSSRGTTGSGGTPTA